MFVREIVLLGRPLAPHLRDQLGQLESLTMRETDAESLAPERLNERIAPIAVPSLLRSHVEFDTNDDVDKVTVRVKVPVTGDIRLLEYVPDGYDGLRVKAKITDDLERGADEPKGTFISDLYDKPSPDRRSGFVLTKSFPSSATADEIRDWARGLLDQIETLLPAMRQQIDVHHDRQRKVLTERAEARRQALTRASALKGELGRGA